MIQNKELNYLSIDHVKSHFSERKQLLLNALAQEDMSNDIFGSKAIANLYTGKCVDASNKQLQKVAQWFELPHPHGRDHSGECDFAAIKLCRAYYQFNGSKILSINTLEEIKRFFLTRDFKSKYLSENHAFLFHTSCYLAGQAFPDEIFRAYGCRGRELLEQDKTYLSNFIRFRAKQGWAEFDSVGYFSPDWECLTCLYDFAEDEEIRKLAAMMMDLLLVDMVVDSLKGMYCGAHGRIYSPHARDHGAEATYPLQYLYFGNTDGQPKGQCLVDALLSGYQPNDLIMYIALDRKENYENRESKHLHCATCGTPMRQLEPVKGRIRKYTYWTPDYVMGCVQYQDPYPEGSEAAWYAHHQQHEWDLTMGMGTASRIFTHHPGSFGTEGQEHGYWTGDLGCCCGHFFQHKSILAALYDIPENEPCRFIHAYVPIHAFDEVINENGWIFMRGGNVYAALRMMGGHVWTEDGEWKDMEVISPGRRNGAVCEAGTDKEYGSFTLFIKEVSENRLHFNREKMQMEYSSVRWGSIYLDTCGNRKVNGQAADLDYPTYDCPYVKSEWDSGIVQISKGSRQVVYDFNRAVIKEL